jgi:UDP-N-acetyl-D-mannosaminuronic acid dehydrogenase
MNVAVVGLGRVGLPLALSFADRGLGVIGVEREPAVLEQLAAGQMPFRETGTQELLERVLPTGRLERTRAVQDAARADHIVLTLGTPTHVHIEIDVSQIRQVLDDLLPVLREGHSIVLRSTVAPGTTEWVAGYIEQRRGFRVGEDLFVAHVPERIATNHFVEEIATLPTIVGGVGEGSGERAAELFSVFGTQLVQTTPVQAELAKIWTNILRYAQFALPNLLMMNCDQYGANVF